MDTRDPGLRRIISQSARMRLEAACPAAKEGPRIILPMGLPEQIQKDMVEAMRARQEPRLSTLRMVKSALKNKEIEKRGPLEEKEVLAVLSTLIKQRKDSVEQFTKGNRPELAAKESEEIKIIEGYLPPGPGDFLR